MSDNAHILVVDDQADTLALLELTLQTAGYSVQTASNGEEAINLLSHDSFDALVLDIMMPEINGFEVIRKLDEQNIVHPPIVFLTARVGIDDRQIGEKLGAIAYLTKPATRGQLLDAVRLALDSRKQSSAQS
jgi:two-component system copper resistance phosphate regulon response regulator CusR